MGENILTLLHLENDPRLTKAAARILSSRGFRVISAHSLGDVERYLEGQIRPDVFLFDLALGDRKNGFEFAEEICQRYDFPRSSFFFLSGFTDTFPRPLSFPRENVFQKPMSTERISWVIWERLCPGED